MSERCAQCEALKVALFRLDVRAWRAETAARDARFALLQAKHNMASARFLAEIERGRARVAEAALMAMTPVTTPTPAPPRWRLFGLFT